MRYLSGEKMGKSSDVANSSSKATNATVVEEGTEREKATPTDNKVRASCFFDEPGY